LTTKFASSCHKTATANACDEQIVDLPVHVDDADAVEFLVAGEAAAGFAMVSSLPLAKHRLPQASNARRSTAAPVSLVIAVMSRQCFD
jgi:hypothetical protein